LRNSPRAAEFTRRAEEFDVLRVGLQEVASEAEDAGQVHLAGALRRIAFLSEIWECLDHEPDQTEPAALVAEYCLSAIERLVCELRTGNINGTTAVCNDILRRSDERWSEYLGSLDSTICAQCGVDEPAPVDEASFPQDDAPPALDQATLLQLLHRFAGFENQQAPCQPVVESLQSGSTHSAPAAEAEHLPIALSQPQTSIDIPTRDGQQAAERIAASGRSSLEIPPLPARFELDDEMREAFLADAIDLFERIERIVIGLGSLDEQQQPLHELGRCFHTLKGAAGSVGLDELAGLVHEVEEQLEHLTVVSPELEDLLYQVVNYLEKTIDWLRRPPVPIHSTMAVPASASGEVVATAAVPSDSSTGFQAAVADPVPSLHAGSKEGPIRVPAARFDELTDLASELIVQGRFWHSQAESMKNFAQSVQESRNRLLGCLDRLHDAGLWREGQVPTAQSNSDHDIPAHLRRLEEQSDDLAVLAASAHAAASPMADRGDTLVRLSLQVWDSFQSLRIVPIRGLFQRLVRVIHDAARVEGRLVDVVMKGEETGVDRAVQDKAFEPLLHVVRNAVGHGIESRSDRIRAGKNETGCITLEARREANTLVIAVHDDGKGLDHEGIAEKARQLGWLGPDERPSLTRLHTFLFQPGFSTKTQANAISGRGVGMDVVAREVERLRGTLDLASQPGRGTQLTIRLPARLALEPALIVRVRGQPLAIPASHVEHAQPLEHTDPSPDPVAQPVESRGPAPSYTGDSAVNYRGQLVPLVFASEMLGIGRCCSAV
jgi:chemotaxis protein histidine kinase CheA